LGWRVIGALPDVPRPFVWNVAALLPAASDALLSRFGA